MNQTRFIPIGVACAALVAAGCDNKTPPPPAASSGTSQPLGGLSQNPTSIPGKSAAAGRRTAQAIESQQAQAVGAADEISGQAGVVKVGDVEFRPPSTWQKGTPGPMQAAVYQINSDAGPVTCAFFQVGGDTASNVSRWKGMMRDDAGGAVEPTVRTQLVSGVKVTIVSMSGTYTPASMGGGSAPQPGTGFRGAIFEAPGGPVQVRMTGPAAAVDAADSAWMTMVLGARR